MENTETIAFKIIASVGTARSMFVEAIRKAKEGKREEALQLIEEGNSVFLEGHKAHMELVTKEAKGEDFNLSLLLVHAEDQLMSAETIRIISEEIIELYDRVN